MAEPQKDGSTWGEHLERAVEIGRRPESELYGPDVPPALSYLWDWYGELVAACAVGMNGRQPVSYTDIDAWARLTGRRVRPDEVDAIVRLDRVMRAKVESSEEE